MLTNVIRDYERVGIGLAPAVRGDNSGKRVEEDRRALTPRVEWHFLVVSGREKWACFGLSPYQFRDFRDAFLPHSCTALFRAFWGSKAAVPAASSAIERKPM